MMDKILLYDTLLLKSQISENSKKIDQYLKELKELEIRLSNGLSNSYSADVS
jgi:hypothetical protein